MPRFGAGCSAPILHLRKLHVDLTAGVIAPDFELDGGAGGQRGNDGWQLIRLLHRLAVELENHVARLDAGPCRGAAFLNTRHQRPLRLRQAERIGEPLIDILDHDTQLAPRDMAMRFELIADVHRHIDRDRERDALIATRASVDLRVDPYDLTAHVEQWPTRVAGVDRHIGLNEWHVPGVWQGAALGTHDAGGDAVLETEGRTDGNHPLTHLEIMGIAQLDRRQILGRDLDDRDIALGIDADDLGGVFAPISQAHRDLARAVDHVCVGQNRSVGTHDEARSLAAHRSLLRRLNGEAAEELTEGELPERLLLLLAGPGILIIARVLTLRVGSRHLGHDRDVDDRRA